MQIGHALEHSALPTESNATSTVVAMPLRAASAALADALIARLWTRMTEAYGHRWTSANGEDPRGGAGQTWAKGLSGVTAQQIGHGLEAAILRVDGWPPVLSEFRAMCLGIPLFAEVNRELLAIGSNQCTPFARLVWGLIDVYAHRHASSQQAERMRREAYILACDHVMRGEPLPAEPVALLEQQGDMPQGIPLTREERMEKLNQIRALLGQPTPKPGDQDV